MSDRRRGQAGKQWWMAIVGSVGFCLVGLVFMPGFISREPTPAPSLASEDTLAEAGASIPASAAYDSLAGIDPLPTHPDAAAMLVSQAFDCMITANETVEIGSSILGRIESIDVERSDFVEAGQVLATLESSVEQAAVRVAKARADRKVEIESTKVSLMLGEKRRSRAADLFKENTLSLDLRDEVDTEARLAEYGVEQARENHRLAVLQLEQAEATLARRTIRSPVSGFVVERLMSAGEVVDEQTILTVAEVDPLRVDVILPTQLFGSVAAGDSVEITPEVPLYPSRTAEVAIVDRVLDAASGTFGVRLLLPNPERDLPGGLRCQARLLPGPTELAAASPSPREADPTP